MIFPSNTHGCSEDGVLPRNLSLAAGKREIPPFAKSVRDDETALDGRDETVGAPTYKVTLEVSPDVTNCQNGIAPEVMV